MLLAVTIVRVPFAVIKTCCQERQIESQVTKHVPKLHAQNYSVASMATSTSDDEEIAHLLRARGIAEGSAQWTSMVGSDTQIRQLALQTSRMDDRLRTLSDVKLVLDQYLSRCEAGP